MAHRSNIVQVMDHIEPSQESEQTVTDPVCGMKMNRKESRHVLFREDDTIYFCSKDCQTKFLYPSHGKKSAA